MQKKITEFPEVEAKVHHLCKFQNTLVFSDNAFVENSVTRLKLEISKRSDFTKGYHRVGNGCPNITSYSNQWALLR